MYELRIAWGGKYANSLIGRLHRFIFLLIFPIYYNVALFFRYASAEGFLFVDSKLGDSNDDDDVSYSEGVGTTKCTVCGSIFLKSKINSVDNRGTCYICHSKRRKSWYKVTANEVSYRSKLTKYLVTDENKQNYYQCDLCSFACESFPDVFMHHYRSEHPDVAAEVGTEYNSGDEEDFYQCEKCEFRCKSKKTLVKHRVDDHSVLKVNVILPETAIKSDKINDQLITFRDGVFFCTACSRTYHTRTYARRHLRRVHGEKKYFCEECGKGFTLRHKARVHQQRHAKRRPYMCDVCGRRFVDKSNMASHQRKNLCAKYTCYWCDQVFYNKATLRDHLSQCNQQRFDCVEAPVAPQEESKLECANCAAVFTTKKALRRHIIAEYELTPYPCGLCARRFSTKRALNKHSCEDCKSNVERGEDIMFLIVVNADNTYSCKLCGKICRKLEYLKQHLRLHSGSKPYVCQYCGKAYAARSSLTSHMLTEMNLRRYACSVCGKRYNTSSHLTAHTRKHHRLREYKCTTCDKEFAYLRDLNEHANTHNEVKPYFCDKCGGFFKTERYLKIHWERCSTLRKK